MNVNRIYSRAGVAVITTALALSVATPAVADTPTYSITPTSNVLLWSLDTTTAPAQVTVIQPFFVGSSVVCSGDCGTAVTFPMPDVANGCVYLEVVWLESYAVTEYVCQPDSTSYVPPVAYVLPEVEVSHMPLLVDPASVDYGPVTVAAPAVVVAPVLVKAPVGFPRLGVAVKGYYRP